MSDNELKYVNDVFKKNWIAPVGPHITKFEEMLSNKHENYSVAALNSGTSAIHLALIILGVKSGDDVYVLHLHLQQQQITKIYWCKSS